MIHHLGDKAFQIIHVHKDAWNPEAFRDRYSEVLDRYDYIVGDWGYSQLRLKGFFKENNPKASKDSTIASLQDYLNEYCNFGCAYFVIERVPHLGRPFDPETPVDTGESELVGEQEYRYRSESSSRSSETRNEARNANRPEKSAAQAGDKGNRQENGSRPENNHKRPHHNRNDQGNRSDGSQRNEHHGKNEQGNRNHQGNRGDRPNRNEQHQRQDGANRNENGPRQDGNRSEHQSRQDGGTNRNEHPARNEGQGRSEQGGGHRNRNRNRRHRNHRPDKPAEQKTNEPSQTKDKAPIV